MEGIGTGIWNFIIRKKHFNKIFYLTINRLRKTIANTHAIILIITITQFTRLNYFNQWIELVSLPLTNFLKYTNDIRVIGKSMCFRHGRDQSSHHSRRQKPGNPMECAIHFAFTKCTAAMIHSTCRFIVDKIDNSFFVFSFLCVELNAAVCHIIDMQTALQLDNTLIYSKQ